jgi:predicted nuclease of predicted toxin-antitoxin system
VIKFLLDQGLPLSAASILRGLGSDFHRYPALDRAATPSVIRIRIEGLKGSDSASMLADLAKTIELELNSGCAVSVTRSSVRVRRLPLGSKRT